MEVYYYCSYTSSPVGYILGKLTAPSEDGALALRADRVDTMIHQCFEAGMVRNACGLLTQAPQRYFLLLKKLIVNGNQGSPDYFLNIAFVTENRQEYARWLENDDAVTADTVAKAGQATMVLDQNSDFGYKIDGKALAELTKMKFGSLLGKCRAAALEDGLYFELASHSADADEVMQALGISSEEQDLELIAEDKNWFRVIKKKQKRKHLTLWLILLLVLGMMIYLLTHRS